MKVNYLLYFLYLVINLAVALSCFYYPVSRDEFFYLDHHKPNPFLEYYDSYFYSNARINQFFANFISRSDKWIEILFGIAVFNGFFMVLYLNIYRKLPKISKTEDLYKYFLLIGFFILLINYFGEMFYYTPFSTNYTLSHIFYLLYLFVSIDYFIYQKVSAISKIPGWLFPVMGVYLGMSNEHIPPALLIVSSLAGAYEIFKKKKLPNYKIILLNISLFLGYLLLFFAPGNKAKEDVAGKSPLDIGIVEYKNNLFFIMKNYYYYNGELLAATLLTGVLITIYYKRIKKMSKELSYSITTYIFIAILIIFILGVSPIIGTRLLFFSSILMIIILYHVFNSIITDFKVRKLLVNLSFLWLAAFFIISVMVTFNGNKNYKQVMAEIAQESRVTKNVVIKEGFSYSIPKLGRLNRKVLIDNGCDYIDNDSLKNTEAERNLIRYFNLKNISHQ